MRRKENFSFSEQNLFGNMQASTKETFLSSFVSKCFERGQIDSKMLGTFNSLLQNINRKLISDNTILNDENIKTLAQLIILIEYNLLSDTVRHPIKIQILINFFRQVYSFFSSTLPQCCQDQKIKIPETINIFWPLFEIKTSEPTLAQLQKKITALNPFWELNQQNLEIECEQFLLEVLSYTVYSNPEQYLRSVMLNTLQHANKPYMKKTSIIPQEKVNNSTFIEYLMVYLETTLKGKQEEQFKKALTLISRVLGQNNKHMYSKILFNKVKEQSNHLLFFVQVSSMQHFQKILITEDLLELSILVLEKIFDQKMLNAETTKILEILNKISPSFYNIDRKYQKTLSQLPIKAAKWLIFARGEKKQIKNSSNNLGAVLEQKARMMMEGQNSGYEEQKMIEFMKKMVQSRSMGEAQQETQQLDPLELKKCSEQLRQFFKQFIDGNLLKPIIPLKEIQFLFQEKVNEHIRKFILEVFPHLIKEFQLSNQNIEKTLFYEIMIRKAEIQCKLENYNHKTASKTIEELFYQAHLQIKSKTALNYHYVLCFMLLKYQIQNPENKEHIRKYLTKEIRCDLVQKSGCLKKNKMLILNLNLLIITFDFEIGCNSIKLKMKQLIRKPELLSSNLDPHALFSLSSKDVQILCADEAITLPQGFLQMLNDLNNNLDSYEKDYLNLFYCLVIQYNDIVKSRLIANQSTNIILPHMIQFINLMRKNSCLSQFYTVGKVLHQSLIHHTINHQMKAQQQGSGKNNENKQSTENNEMFSLVMNLLLFLKMEFICKDPNGSTTFPKEDLQSLRNKIQDYLITINKQYNKDMLQSIYLMKNKNMIPSSNKYSQYLKQSQIIKFYSEACEEPTNIRIFVTKIGLQIWTSMTKFLGKQFQWNQVSQNIKQLFLIFSFETTPKELQISSQENNLLKTYVQMQYLMENSQNTKKVQEVVSLLKENLHNISKLITESSTTSKRICFTALKTNLIGYFADQIVKFISLQRKEDKIYQLIKQIIDKSQPTNIIEVQLMKVVGQRMEGSFVQLFIRRFQNNIQKVREEWKNNVTTSRSLYKFIKKIHFENANQVFQSLVEEIIRFDDYGDVEKSTIILKELANASLLITERTKEISEIIFNYVTTLIQIFASEPTLEISNFICEFFNLTNKEIRLSDIKNLQSKEKVLVCSNLPNYRCLKCDQKRLFCQACMITCHSQHPVVFAALPPEIRNAQCQCKEIDKNCAFFKPNQSINNPPLNPFGNHVPLVPSEIQSFHDMSSKYYTTTTNNIFSRPPKEPNLSSIDMIDRIERIKASQKWMKKSIRADQFNEPDRVELQYYEEEQDNYEAEIRNPVSNRWRNQNKIEYEREEIIPKMGANRYERFFEKDPLDVFIGGYKAPHVDLNKAPADLNKAPVDLKIQSLPKQTIEEYQLIKQEEVPDQEYQSIQEIIPEQPEKDQDLHSVLSDKYIELPRFMALMNNLCNKKQTSSQNNKSTSYWKPSFEDPFMNKIFNFQLKICNNASFHVEVRKDNPIHNVSCVLIKRNIAHNSKYILICSNTEIYTYNKERFLTILLQAKNNPGFQSINRHSATFEVHSLQFSGVDQNIFGGVGLHNLCLFNLSNDGIITRTNNRYNVNNLYINKVKMAKIGIFLGLEKQIRVLNYTCKHFLTIKAQEVNTLIRQWSISEKLSGCYLYFVCPNGNIFQTQINASDQGRKQFTVKIHDQRKGNKGCGASIFCKNIADMGKIMVASFKDGSNIIGRVNGDQLEDMTNMNLKCGINNIFDTFFILGHIEAIKSSDPNQLYLITTTKKYFPPEMSFHQGYLTVIKFKKSCPVQIQILNNESTCQYFTIININETHFVILSMHTDGSLSTYALNKLHKNVIEEEIKKIKEFQIPDSVSSGDSNLQQKNSHLEETHSLRKVLNQYLKLQNIQPPQEKPVKLIPFREQSENLKLNVDFALQKGTNDQYEIKINNFAKIPLGISFPQFGTVILPTRVVKNVIELGFTNLEALYFYGLGTIKLTFIKNQEAKFNRQPPVNPRLLEKLEKLERMQRYGDYPEEKIYGGSASLMSLIGKQEYSQDILVFGKTFETFKSNLPKFDDIFNLKQESSENSIQKTNLILRILLKNCLKQKSIPCDSEDLLDLARQMKKVTIDANKEIFQLTKINILLCMKLYEQQVGKKHHIFNDDDYGLKLATQARIDAFYIKLKTDISYQQIDEFLELLLSVAHEDIELAALYIARYPLILNLLSKRIKLADSEERTTNFLQIVCIGYSILKTIAFNVEWIPGIITNIFNTFIKSYSLRNNFYNFLVKYSQITVGAWIKNVQTIDSQEGNIEKYNKEPAIQKFQPNNSQNSMEEIFNMFSRGEIDEETMIKMIEEQTKQDYLKQQEMKEENLQNIINQNVQNLPQQQFIMEAEHSEAMKAQEELFLVRDLIEECMDRSIDAMDIVAGKIAALYVLAKYADQYHQCIFKIILEKCKKFIEDLSIKSDANFTKSTILSYLFVFQKMISKSTIIKSKGKQNYVAYQAIREQIFKKLSKMTLEGIGRVKKIPNILSMVFVGERNLPNLHFAYGLTQILLPPEQPCHILLSLECYWLLAEEKDHYAKFKDITSIQQGMDSGNILKVYQIAKKSPEIWRQCAKIQEIQDWIRNQKPGWISALELLAIYYEG